MCAGKATVEGKKVVISKKKAAGRNAEFEWDCRFCGRELRTEGFINDHYSKTHKKEGKLKHLPRSHTKLICPLHKRSAVVNKSLKPFGNVAVCPEPDCQVKPVEKDDGQEKKYVYPVENCAEPINNNRKKLVKHL